MNRDQATEILANYERELVQRVTDIVEGQLQQYPTRTAIETLRTTLLLSRAREELITAMCPTTPTLPLFDETYEDLKERVRREPGHDGIVETGLGGIDAVMNGAAVAMVSMFGDPLTALNDFNSDLVE